MNFDERVFDILIKQHHIDKDFISGWSYQDSLSRWYALGTISLTRCLMSKTWNDALPSPFDLEVYDASLGLMWIMWRMPDAVRSKVDLFMRNNFQEIKNSFGSIVDAKTNAEWFRRYGDRLIGSNLPWEIRSGDTSAVAETLLTGENVTANILARQFIGRVFLETGGEVLKLVAQS